ncbi:MAG: ABC transporter substrate-binding protein [Lachnospiraceae bacterium]|jgi:NitT/TauT family transport system substrate-binding protein|nr:ABC transporter substrate-binding protein [Lachnospiraceae bacterium]
MKKVLAWVMAAALMMSLAACTSQKPEDSQADSKPESQTSAETDSSTTIGKPEDVKIAALKGPTAMGMLQLMELSEQHLTPDTYQFTLAGSPDEILGSIIQGDFDIAAVPTNVAATLYNKTQGEVQIAAINTLGVLYCIENGDTIYSVEDLRGKTIYNLGKGATPEFALNFLLEKNGLNPETDVDVVYKTESTEVASLLQSGEASIALLPQPFVTSVLAQNENLRVALDFTEEWNQVGDGSTLTMGCIVVQKKFAEEHPEALERFLEAYEDSVEFTNDTKTLETAAQYAEKFGVLKAAVAAKAIPQCNIVFEDGEDMKRIAGGFLQVMFEADPASVGGAVPDDAFYYDAD